MAGVAPASFKGVRPGRAPDYGTPPHTRPGVRIRFRESRSLVGESNRQASTGSNERKRKQLSRSLDAGSGGRRRGPRARPASRSHTFSSLLHREDSMKFAQCLFEPLRILLVVVLNSVPSPVKLAESTLVRGAARTRENRNAPRAWRQPRRLSVSSSSKSLYLPYSAAPAGLLIGSWGRKDPARNHSPLKTRQFAATQRRICAFLRSPSQFPFLRFSSLDRLRVFRASRAESVPSLKGERAPTQRAIFAIRHAQLACRRASWSLARACFRRCRFLFLNARQSRK